MTTQARNFHHQIDIFLGKSTCFAISPPDELDEDLLPSSDLLHVGGLPEEAGLGPALLLAVSILDDEAAGGWNEEEKEIFISTCGQTFVTISATDSCQGQKRNASRKRK